MALPDTLRAWRSVPGKAALYTALTTHGSPVALAARDLLADLTALPPVDASVMRETVQAWRRERHALVAEAARLQAAADILDQARDVPDWEERRDQFLATLVTASAKAQRQAALVDVLRSLSDED